MLNTNLESLPLYRLLRRGSTRFNLEMGALVVFAGIANAALLAIINAAAENARDEAANGRMMALFAVAIGLYLYTQRFVLYTAVTEVERLLSGIRVRIADKIRNSDLYPLEQIGRSEIFGLVSRETQMISQAAGTLTISMQSSMMVIFSVLYILYLSKSAFVITIVVTALGLFLHFRRSKELNALLRDAQRRENDFLAALTDLLDGFKEARLSRARSADLFDRIDQVSSSVRDVKTRAGTKFSAHYIFAQTMFYALLAAIVFVLPRVSSAYGPVVLKLTAAVLFIIGPLGAIVATIPLYSAANVAATNIFLMEQKLQEVSEPGMNGRPEAAPPAAFRRIELKRVVFQYSERGKGSVFRLGPVDLEINSGEILFIVGGNGSGKSTLLHVLTGLYHPQSGSVVMDDTLLEPATAAWYRSHFTAVFSDYHLFDRLYGLNGMPQERVNELLRWMQIQDKTAYEGGRFTTIDLSSGQRKRLALVVALLEDRPILVLDEWAADQDPVFRRFFYEEILPELKKRGKTIVAATHDDRYFPIADRVLKMEYGTFVDHAGL